MHPRYCIQYVNPCISFSSKMFIFVFSVDGQLFVALYYGIDTVTQLFTKLVAVIVVSPIFSIPGLFVVLVGAWFGHVFMRAQRPLKREQSNAKAPVLGHFGSTISGLGLLIASSSSSSACANSCLQYRFVPTAHKPPSAKNRTRVLTDITGFKFRS